MYQMHSFKNCGPYMGIPVVAVVLHVPYNENPTVIVVVLGRVKFGNADIEKGKM
jgi:hypothetical protein